MEGGPVSCARSDCRCPHAPGGVYCACLYEPDTCAVRARIDRCVAEAVAADRDRWAHRLPLREEMEVELAGRDEYFAFGGTIRRCIDCRTPVFGGPTRCERCVGRMEEREACAKVAVECTWLTGPTGQSSLRETIAAAIRARGDAAKDLLEDGATEVRVSEMGRALTDEELEAIRSAEPYGWDKDPV